MDLIENVMSRLGPNAQSIERQQSGPPDKKDKKKGPKDAFWIWFDFVRYGHL